MKPATGRFLPSSEPMQPKPHASHPGLAVFYDCEICGGFHPNGFYGDCRDNLNRLTDEQLIARYPAGDFVIVDMEEAD